jgi:MFS family permease
MTAYLQLLRRNPAFSRLWLAYAISLLGDWFNTIVLATLIASYAPEESQGIAISGLLLARTLPPLLLSPFAGVLVDRFNRKRLLIASDLLRSVVVLGFLLVDSPDKLWLIYALLVTQFSLSTVFEPGRNALLPNVCAADDLVGANTLGSITWSVMLAMGAIIGGVVASLVGTQAALLIGSLTFIASATLISRIRLMPPSITVGDSSKHDTSTFMDGLRYLRAHPDIASILLVKLGGSVGSIDNLVIVYATTYFVIGEEGRLSLGLLWSAFGLGSILGPLLLNRFHHGSIPRLRRLIIVGYAWITLGWLLFGVAGSLAFAAFGLGVKAFGSSVYWTYSSVILQKRVPNHYLGRIFALDMAGFQFSTVISTIIVGVLIDELGSAQARNISIGTAFASLVPLVMWVVVVKWLERRESQHGTAPVASPIA